MNKIDLSKLIEDGRYDPTLDRLVETKFSLFLKYVMNFLIALVQFILNIPLLLYGVIASFAGIYTTLTGKENFLLEFPREHLGWALFIFVALNNLYFFTKKNIVSKEVNLVWAVNFLGKVRNRFHSYQESEKYLSNLNELVEHNAKKAVANAVKEYEDMIDELKEIIDRLEDIGSFPKDFFDSVARLIDLTAHTAIHQDDSRYMLDNVLSKILGEVCTHVLFAHQGTIILFEEDQSLSIAGSFNMKETVVLNRKFNLGEDFSGKVITGKEAIWIDDLSHPEARQFGFKPNSKRSYEAILGYPVVNGREVIGLINIHFSNKLDFTDSERWYTEKLLEICSQFIISVTQIKQMKISGYNGKIMIIDGGELDESYNVSETVKK